MEKMREHGQAVLEQNEEQKKFYLMTIIGEIEGHDVLGGSSKATKYEHIIPQLALIEDDAGIEDHAAQTNQSSFVVSGLYNHFCYSCFCHFCTPLLSEETSCDPDEEG